MRTQTGSALRRFLVRVGTWVSKRGGLRGFDEPATGSSEHAPRHARKPSAPSRRAWRALVALHAGPAVRGGALSSCSTRDSSTAGAHLF